MSRSPRPTRVVRLAALAATPLLLAACGSGTGSSSSSGGGQTVYMLLPNSTTVRFTAQDGPDFQAAMKKDMPGVKVVIQNAENDPQKQVQQVETAINGGASAIVLVAADPYIAGGALQKASTAKVPVLLYDHDARGGNAAAQVVFDSLSVGQNQGKDAAALLSGGTTAKPKVIARIYGNQGDYGTTQYKKGQDQYLKPLIDAGKVKVACETYTPNWDPAKAQSEMEQCLTKTGNKLDAVVVMNDGTAGGSVAALSAQSLAGKVPVIGGQDADLQAVQYILLGYQYGTVYKPFKLQASKAAELTTQLLKNGKINKSDIDGYVDNGFMKPGVPAVFLPVQNLHADTVGTLVKDGVWTWKQICTGPAAATATCKKEMA
ncbi:ABC transporter substrate-binding protein [Streptomyces sp. NBC_01262]|uniref:ABC transporter substrate-binding protein n=1 Tax=Streptomyces sp. NBC_01262 TaxID=2903803 RepID=UPI002E373F8E|nr:sugar ABC transporter substrate-binding protein [Streptomyces sp. NBC_01262]